MPTLYKYIKFFNLINIIKAIPMSKNYGLTAKQLLYTEQKIKNQNDFLESSFLIDNKTGVIQSLKDFVVSANHNPYRYYSQIQNIVNTISNEAKDRDLVPLFLTLTAPSRYHKYKKAKSGGLMPNPKYDGFSTGREANKYLTQMFTILRNDRAMRKDNKIDKNNRMHIRVNEPHQDGTPHTHIILFVPKESIERIIKAFKHLYNNKGNKIEVAIDNPVSYIMKYILKLIPKSKDTKISTQDRYLNAWYAYHRIRRFSCSRTLIPLYIYKKISQYFTLYEATHSYIKNHILPYKECGKLIDIDLICGVDDYGMAETKTIYTKNNNLIIKRLVQGAKSA